jgi:3-oxoacyl-(acyl-carrier-protein) synthase/SAM-dependent methyltransferase/acyl carrier protein
MAQSDSFTQEKVLGTEELSPVKRALVEIRQLRAELEASRRGPTEPVAILGMAVRLPGGVASPERFWEALAAGEDLITTVPPERWDALSYASADSDQPGTMYDIHGGFLSEVDAFDAEFFGIHPREAASMDPQQRILLELAWEALERANIDPRSLMNTKTGIYLGMTNSDYARLLLEDPRGIDGYSGVGAAGSIAAGRIAYFLGTHGPAVVVDTACSSSLVALHQAVQSLRRQETDLAIVGATNLILSPEMNIGFSRTRMLSRDGHCKTFDAAADGYVRSEGSCVIVLKRLTDANRDGNRVLANLHGSAVNQDGRSAGITAPNGPAQEAVMREALANAALEPNAVNYVEAHGTGTPLGDPIEVQALGAVYGARRSAESPLLIGSVKTNLGHTEAAAGLAGLVKVVLMMQTGHGIAPHLHFKQPNPQIDWRQWPIEVPVRLVSWPDASGTRYAGVSSFGFSGTNAHVIVGSAETSQESRGAEQQPHAPLQEPSLLCISAADNTALRTLAERYIGHLQQNGENFRDICHTAAVGRAQLPQRIALIARDAAEAVAMLQALLAGRTVAGLMTSALDGNVAMDGNVATAHNGVNAGALQQIQKEFVQGGRLRYVVPASPLALRKMDLPVYPFQRKRFWFGAPPQAKRQQEREETWRSMREEAERQSLQAPLGWKPEGYPERFRALERLTWAHARNLLAAAGAFPNGDPASVDEVLQRCAFQPIYRKLVRRWLLGLVQEGVLMQSDNIFRPAGVLAPVELAPYWEDAARHMEDDPGALAYLRQCGALLSDVVAGRKSALETLFPEGSFALAEGLYETSAQARYVNPIVASALREVVRRIGRRRSVRILELGGGTGGTTAAILPWLPADKVEYWFTDVSELFLSRARRKFEEYPFVRYMLCDVDRDFEQQGFQSGTFDVVVAANVIHAARNLDSALGRVQGVLSSGGTLVLLETTHHHTWFDMSTGLIEGWQHFADADRQDHPLLTVDQWHGILDRTGFAETAAFPSAASPASNLGQHVLFARSPETSQAHRMSTVQASGVEKVAKAMSQPLAQKHGAVSQRLSDISSEASEDEVAAVVKETICQVFRLDLSPDELGDRDRLTDLGMDSLIALELRGELAKRLGLVGRISSTIALDTGTVGELVRSLSAALAPAAANPSRTDHTESPQPRRREQPHLTVAQLEEMSEEEVEQLLRKRLSRQ